MITKTFIFKVNNIEAKFEKEYDEEPSKKQVMEDIKEWFFEEHYMWFGVVENGEETNLEDY